MLSFFHGLRRKIGVITLVMACVLAAAWVRSLSTYDLIGLPKVRNGIPCVLSTQQLLTLMVERPVGHTSSYSWFLGSEKTSDFNWIILPVNKSPLTDTEISWSCRSCGFGHGKRTNVTSEHPDGQFSVNVDFTFLTIPYWSIVIPLTLLSAYLLLSKPRVAKPTAVTEN